MFNKVFNGVTLLFKRTLPVLVTAVGTFLLVIFLPRRKHTRRTILTEGASHTTPNGANLDHLTICLVAVAMSFFIFITPVSVTGSIYYIFRFYDTTFTIELCTFYRISGLLFLIALSNSSAVFLIYFWKLPSFREAVKFLFTNYCYK